MNIQESIQKLHALSNLHPDRKLDLFVKVFNPGALGGTPCVEVKHIDAGFDWDAGKIMIETHTVLTTLTSEDIAAIRKSVSGGQSWHAYQSYKKQAERIKILEAEIASLKAILPVI